MLGLGWVWFAYLRGSGCSTSSFVSFLVALRLAGWLARVVRLSSGGSKVLCLALLGWCFYASVQNWFFEGSLYRDRRELYMYLIVTTVLRGSYCTFN